MRQLRSKLRVTLRPGHARAAVLVAVLVATAGCTSAEERAARADAQIKEERLNTLAEYKECVRDADGKSDKLRTCDALLKAVEALK
ncbi:MAG: hypothetical protein R3286_00920 [Gammaproteobacteria bacterium]|nr:hypothetical protein [Gammaproteobacteria bacterium]